MEDWEEERGKLWEKRSTQEERWSRLLSVRGGNTLNNWGTFAGKKADLTFLGWTSAQLTDLPCWDPGWGLGCALRSDKKGNPLGTPRECGRRILIVTKGGILVWDRTQTKSVQILIHLSMFSLQRLSYASNDDQRGWEAHLAGERDSVYFSSLFFPILSLTRGINGEKGREIGEPQRIKKIASKDWSYNRTALKTGMR